MARPLLLDLAEPLQDWQKVLPYALLLSITFALYGATLTYGFVWDDGLYVQTNYRIQALTLENLRAIWLTPYLGHFAPLHHSFLALIHFFFGLNPLGYHLAQVLLHAICLGVLYRVLAQIETPRVALLACVLLAVHPTTIETVAWISETKSSLALLFLLLSFQYYLSLRQHSTKKGWILCGLFLMCSVLSKINTVVAPLIFLLYEYREHAKIDSGRRAHLASLFAISGVMVSVHLASFYGPSSKFPEPTYYPGGLPVHLLNLPTLLLFYLQMLFFPQPLSGWHLIPIYGAINSVLIFKWLGVLLLAWLLFRSNRSVQFWGSWFVVFLLPVLQIVPFPLWVAERYLYVPAVGMFVLAGRGFFRVLDWCKPRVVGLVWEIAAIAALLSFAGLSWSHVPVWKSDLAFWEATEATCTTAAYCHLSLGRALLRDGQTDRAIKEFVRAVEIRPTPANLFYLGDVYLIQGKDFQRGLRAYQAAQVQMGDSPPPEFYARLGRAYLLAGDLEAATQVIDQGIRKSANDRNLLIVRAFLHWRLKKFEEAHQSLTTALAGFGVESDAVAYLYQYWEEPRQVKELLADLNAAETQGASKHLTPHRQ